MKTRYIGNAAIKIVYVTHIDGAEKYTVRVEAGKYVWKFERLYSSPAWPGVDPFAPSSYDKIAQDAIEVGSYYASADSLSHDTPDWAPSAEVADAIDEATWQAKVFGGIYKVSR